MKVDCIIGIDPGANGGIAVYRVYGRLFVHFLSEASAIAPGQSAVFYIGRRVVGGFFF